MGRGVTLTLNKTKKGIKRFVNAWLNRAPDQEAVLRATEQYGILYGSMKKWTQLDDLTHDFMQSQAFRNDCLAKFGQYVTYSGEVTDGSAVDGAKQVPGGGVCKYVMENQNKDLIFEIVKPKNP